MKTNYYRKHKKPGIPINTKQITIIKMAVNQLGIADGDYRNMLDDRYHVQSCTKLTYDQASEYIKELEGKGFTLIPNKKPGTAAKPQAPIKPRRPQIPRNTGNVIALVSVEEIDKINKVAALIPWREQNGLQLFLMKRMGLKDGKVLTSAHAYLAIEGLKKMFENGMKKQHGPKWWIMQFADEAVMEYIEIHKPQEWR